MVYQEYFHSNDTSFYVCLQDERVCAGWLQKNRVLDSLAKGLPIPLPNEGNQKYWIVDDGSKHVNVY